MTDSQEDGCTSFYIVKIMSVCGHLCDRERERETEGDREQKRGKKEQMSPCEDEVTSNLSK